MSMKNIGKLEQIFLSHRNNCPFCDAELSSTTTHEQYVDGNKSTIYKYGCCCYIQLNEDKSLEKSSVNLTLLNACQAKTTSLFFVLDLHYQLEQKQNNK
jgi:transcription elongation factor Elf1